MSLDEEIEAALEEFAHRLKPGERLMFSISTLCPVDESMGEGYEPLSSKQDFCHLCGGSGFLHHAKTWRG